jgi:hypothetical protein
MKYISNKVAKVTACVLASIAALASSASATIDTANITDAINLIGTVGSAFIRALGTIFVDNLGVILTLVAVGIVIFVFGGFGQMIVKFMFSLFSNIGSKMDQKYNR